MADSIFNSPNDGLYIPLHISWSDMSAYLDWSGLRPMTELEYEKACRGRSCLLIGRAHFLFMTHKALINNMVATGRLGEF